jgi:hypothetical protein
MLFSICIAMLYWIVINNWSTSSYTTTPTLHGNNLMLFLDHVHSSENDREKEDYPFKGHSFWVWAYHPSVFTKNETFCLSSLILQHWDIAHSFVGI